MPAFGKIGYRKAIYLLVLLTTAIPMIFAIGLPVEISKQTRDLYDFIENLKPGSNVAVNFAANVGMYPDAQAATRAGLMHLFRRPLNIVLFHTTPDAPMLSVKELVYVDLTKRVYGEDYVLLPYVGGDEPTLAAIAQNIKGVFSADIRGTPLGQIPLMKKVNTAEDFSLMLTMGHAGAQDDWAIRQWVIPHRVPVGSFTISIIYPALIPYWRAGSMIGMTNGIRGGAEYELLMGTPGIGVKRTDVISATHLLYIALMIIPNLELIRRIRPRKS